MNVGDVVGYVPDACHAFDRGVDGEYPWVFGLKHYKPLPKGGFEERVEELSTERVEDFLSHLKRHPNPDEEKKKLVTLRPNKSWEAEVKAVHEDGTVDLDVKSHNGGVTLHYSNVPVDQLKANARTCHVKGDSEGSWLEGGVE